GPANRRGGAEAARAAGRRMDPRGKAAGRAAVAGRGPGHDRVARLGGAPGAAFDGGHARGSRRRLDHGLRRRERNLLPALRRRARRVPRLRDEHRGRAVAALARGRTVRAALHRDDQRRRRHDRGPLGEGAGRAHVGDRFRPHLPQSQV
ncbi:MAG: hypothetical protein AVDCRST_MAG12-2228, partial [uncultured Rubrobacteraceae bacterium]